MKLSNLTERKVCFKVKTTAPKRYCVKPTTGVIDPKGLVTILVTLQPFDPNDPNEKGKHKFQVLSVYAPEEPFNIETLVSLTLSLKLNSSFKKILLKHQILLGVQWKEASADTVHDWKLKCVLDIPEEGAQTTAPATAAAAAAPASASLANSTGR